MNSFQTSPKEMDPFSRLVFELSKLPGVGEKTATRLAYFILKKDAEYARSLGQSILDAKQKMRLCSRCFTFTEAEICTVCASAKRDATSVCVVEKPSDVLAIEQTGTYSGLYHVLHGALSPLDGIGPEELKIRELLARISESGSTIKEIITATNPSVEGDATALYLSRILRPLGIRVTRLAHGIPVGGMLEYTDRQTIGRAIENRVEVNG